MKNKKVFVVDDDDDIIEMVTYNLKKFGYEVMTAASGLRGMWDLDEDNLPDLVLLDIMMPVLDGYEVCKYIRASDSFRHIPIIMISAKGTSEDIQKGIELGANAYLPKPFSIKALMNEVGKLV